MSECVQGAPGYTPISYRCIPPATQPGIPGIHCKCDQDKAVSEVEWMNDNTSVDPSSSDFFKPLQIEFMLKSVQTLLMARKRALTYCPTVPPHKPPLPPPILQQPSAQSWLNQPSSHRVCNHLSLMNSSRSLFCSAPFLSLSVSLFHSISLGLSLWHWRDNEKWVKGGVDKAVKVCSLRLQFSTRSRWRGETESNPAQQRCFPQ